MTLDFNDAGGRVIPTGTTAKVRCEIVRGDAGSDGILTRSKSNPNVLYLLLRLTVVGGKFDGEVFYDRIGVKGKEEGDDDRYAAIGRERIRKILDASHGYHPHDTSPEAVESRRIESYNDLNGLVFSVSIGVKDSQNVVARVITPDDPAYKDVMADAPF